MTFARAIDNRHILDVRQDQPPVMRDQKLGEKLLNICGITEDESSLRTGMEEREYLQKVQRQLVPDGLL